MARRVRISVSQQTTPLLGCRLVIVADQPTDMPSALFKHYRRAVNPTAPSGGTTDDFIAVCTPAELDSLPAGAPDDDSDRYFRADTIDKTYATATMAEEAARLIVADVSELKEALDAAEVLGTPSVTWVGGAP